MTDEIIIRMVQETGRLLASSPWHEGARHVLPSYNALLQAARENHPDDPIIRVLPAIELGEDGDIKAQQLNILFTQLRIALESLRSGGGAGSTDRPHINSILANVSLSGVDLRGAQLDGMIPTDADLSGADLRGADMRDANLTRANLSGADLRDARLVGTDLTDANLSGVTLRDADLSGLDLSGIDLSGATLRGVDLGRFLRAAARFKAAPSGPAPQPEPEPQGEAGESTRGGGEIADHDRNRLTRAGVELAGVDLTGARLEGADFTNVHWFGARLADSDLTNASLTGADLTGADLTGANLSGANLSGANLSGASLPGVDLSGMDLTGVDLSGASPADVASLMGRLLRQAQGGTGESAAAR